jgi:hypothetical protein
VSLTPLIGTLYYIYRGQDLTSATSFINEISKKNSPLDGRDFAP